VCVVPMCMCGVSDVCGLCVSLSRLKLWYGARMIWVLA